MKRIPLTKGQFALVDDDDFEWLSQYKWCAHVKIRNGRAYMVALRNLPEGGGHIPMHREIVGAKKDDPMVDHKNQDSLDNQKENLRFSNHSLNAANQGLRSDNTSGYKGVYFFKRWGKFVAQIRVLGKTTNLGGFKTAQEAAARYNQAAMEAFGEFASLNAI